MSAADATVSSSHARRGAPTTQRPPGPPQRAMTRAEWRGVLEPLRLMASHRRLLRAPRGDGRITIDMPGYAAPQAAMAPLRLFLRRKGHDARPWGLGTNRGDVAAYVGDLLRQLEPLVARSGRPVNLVGWSLGGVVAREAARERPELVHRIVTYGSPIIGGPTFTAAARRMNAEDCRRLAARQEQRDRDKPLRTPVTAIYSQRDGIVDWRACLDHHSEQVSHVQVRSTHLGLGLDPDVWVAIARALADDV